MFSNIGLFVFSMMVLLQGRAAAVEDIGSARVGVAADSELLPCSDVFMTMLVPKGSLAEVNAILKSFSIEPEFRVAPYSLEEDLVSVYTTEAALNDPSSPRALKTQFVIVFMLPGDDGTCKCVCVCVCVVGYDDIKYMISCYTVMDIHLFFTWFVHGDLLSRGCDM
jgi:hypothetical protein